LAGGFAADAWPYFTDVTWLIGMTRDSPFAARNEIEDVELLVTVPMNVEPSFNVTVALWPDPGPQSLAQLHAEVATVMTIAITSTLKAFPLPTKG
jgi:hypothetical protein